ncbi:1,4-alpha-glucan branching protein GlgB [Cohnella lubricantis]|uniref:1,4-alpha-glucan branching enzyme GlgB n=1 Tax=Cohnella lubricantis TaxID=2163172 RepID=A0A841T8R7_9BACL|nr:1,4-alpha-glucan branching protein GlgB [Cohnella lubricantis]MBB6676446.1 1,4-alpha-glucan branching protein GlgB [Cohnella lubricantis]MBP2117547.1 1,4-alpha-glucan branching enzyme [Cohnella lubricantis]
MTVQSSILSPDDLYLFHRGQLFQAYRTFGAHILEQEGVRGVRFAVWAPHARQVGVAGGFNEWRGERHPLERIGSTGVWAGFIPGLTEGAAYKYEIVGGDGSTRLKADPFAFRSELRPSTASIVSDLGRYEWADEAWRTRKREDPPYERPMFVYEAHLGSWRMDAPEQFRSYRELADELVDYVGSMGFTHIELLPLAEHPLDRSWGYQATGYYAATSRYGPPEGLQTLVDRCHRKGIGVILDWVPGHFCKDDHGLRLFDGTPLYEPADSRIAEKPQWGTLAFDFAKPEVQSFLISNAMFWLDVFHIDGLRVDAVASMIDLHFDKPPGLRACNRHGGTEHLEALEWLRKLNETVFLHYPDTLMMAEDSSAWPGVTAPTYLGGLGFNYKWNMGWMNDSLRYMETDPIERSARHSLLTFSMLYAFSENYVLPLSHDEVVHGKRSLLNKMPGAYEDKFANLRLFYGYWMAHPGKKLLFMGGEFGQFDEWKDAAGLDWPLLRYPLHDALRRYMKDLLGLYAAEPALWEQDHSPEGFEWIDADNAEQSVLSFIRKSRDGRRVLIVVCNFSRRHYPVFRIGVPTSANHCIIFNSDSEGYGGSGCRMPRRIKAVRTPLHGRPFSLELPLPALSALVLEPERIAAE